MPSSPLPLAHLHASLRSTRRGKHIRWFSYYHMDLVDTLPRVTQDFAAIRAGLDLDKAPFNVVKLDAGRRVSFLLYEDFGAPFPALLAADSCDLSRDAVRHTDYAARRNPPILHRKELLLPADHPLVPDAERLTDRLEQLGAFQDTRRIGTREGWARHLASLGIGPDGGPV